MSHYPEFLSLLLASERLYAAVSSLIGPPSGSFYTQVARRTPSRGATHSGAAASASGAECCYPPCRPPADGVRPHDARPGTNYHLDGQANASGARFPDHFSLLVAVAVSDQTEADSGQFTVFPGSHTRSWHAYPEVKLLANASKRSGASAATTTTTKRTLPDLGAPHAVHLAPGDAVLAHPLLAHRGGRNYNACRSRDLIFFRCQAAGVDYNSPARSASFLDDPWSEFVPSLRSHLDSA